MKREAENGYRLVTDEERQNNDHPTDCVVRWIWGGDGYPPWFTSRTNYGWKSGLCVFAVPEGYEFENQDKGE